MNPISKYGVAIVGAGWVAGEYVKAFSGHEQAEVIGMYSRTPGRAARLLESHGLPDAVEYESLDELLGDGRVGIVASCTPPTVRPEHVIRAAESGRHVVIEKPVASTLEDVREMRDAIAKAGVKSVTAFVLRWNPQLTTVKRLIDDGVVGDLIYAEADYWHPLSPAYPAYQWSIDPHGTGTALTGGCHAVDALRHLGGEIVEVSAFSGPPKINPDFNYDPVVVSNVRFSNGSVGKVSVLREGRTPYIFNTRFFGVEGSIQNNRVYSPRNYPGATDYWEFPTTKPDSGDVSHHPFSAMVAHFIECINDDRESPASIHDTWKSMAVCFAIDQSASSGIRVEVDLEN